MDLDRICQFIDWFAGAGLERFELVEGNDRILLARPAQASSCGPAVESDGAPADPAPCAHDPVARSDTIAGVEAPLHGICYFSASPDAPPLVQAGQTVKAGDPLCLIEAMKVLTAVSAPRDGVVDAFAVENGAEVEQGQVLLVLR